MPQRFSTPYQICKTAKRALANTEFDRTQSYTTVVCNNYVNIIQ